MINTISLKKKKKKGLFFDTLTLPERRIRFDQADRNPLLPDVVRLGQDDFWE